MKFSYKLLKKLVPQIKGKKELSEKLALYAFEIDSFKGNAIDIKLPPNRYDAAGHIGLAREISAALGRKFKYNLSEIQKHKTRAKANFRVEIKDKKLCSRYMAQYFDLGKMKKTPVWMKNILINCGMRPINTIVDIMNYAMLETGQPIHAFDYDKLGVKDKKSGIKKIVARKAKGGEKITTLDNQHINLNKDILVIADEKKSLAIAGIKGGKLAEVGMNTKRIVVESANFDSANIYSGSRKLGLITDASMRFSRGISPELAKNGLIRAGELLKELCGAAEGVLIDVYSKKQPAKILKFEVEKFNKFIGADFGLKTIRKYLELLDFKIIKTLANSDFLVKAPAVRTDIKNPEDLFEEVVRLYGYNKLKARAPRLHIVSSGFEDKIVLKDKIRKVLAGLGLNEVYNHSFTPANNFFKAKNYRLVELENPISKEYEYLRPNLAVNLIKNIDDNGRFFGEIRIFELGKVFFKSGESNKINELFSAGIVLASKTEEKLFELKGVLAELFKRVGLVDFDFLEISDSDWIKDFTEGYLKQGEILKIESKEKQIGYLGKLKSSGDLADWKIAVAEFDLEGLLKLVEGEHEYLPLSKYPSMMRDISILVDKTAKVGNIIQSIQNADLKHIDDVDLRDEYEGGKHGDKRSLTFRIVFQAPDKTLTDKEVNNEMVKIEAVLRNEFGADIR